MIKTTNKRVRCELINPRDKRAHLKLSIMKSVALSRCHPKDERHESTVLKGFVFDIRRCNTIIKTSECK